MKSRHRRSAPHFTSATPAKSIRGVQPRPRSGWVQQGGVYRCLRFEACEERMLLSVSPSWVGRMAPALLGEPVSVAKGEAIPLTQQLAFDAGEPYGTNAGQPLRLLGKTASLESSSEVHSLWGIDDEEEFDDAQGLIVDIAAQRLQALGLTANSTKRVAVGAEHHVEGDTLIVGTKLTVIDRPQAEGESPNPVQLNVWANNGEDKVAQEG